MNSIKDTISNRARWRLTKAGSRCSSISQGTKTSAVQFPMPDPPSVRSYVLAFSAQGAVAKNPRRFAQRMSNYLAQVDGAHLHGVFIVGNALCVTRPVDSSLEPAYHVNYTTDHPLAAFKWNLLHDLGRYPRMPTNCVPAIDRYRPKTTYETSEPQHYKQAGSK